MKPELFDFAEENYIVAPLAGAWIETKFISPGRLGQDVAPLAGAWIETWGLDTVTFIAYNVAPLAGAWIETRLKLGLDQGAPRVAPLAGAWIETVRFLVARPACRESHPSRVRGLKPVLTR